MNIAFEEILPKYETLVNGFPIRKYKENILSVIDRFNNTNNKLNIKQIVNDLFSDFDNKTRIDINIVVCIIIIKMRRNNKCGNYFKTKGELLNLYSLPHNDINNLFIFANTMKLLSTFFGVGLWIFIQVSHFFENNNTYKYLITGSGQIKMVSVRTELFREMLNVQIRKRGQTKKTKSLLKKRKLSTEETLDYFSDFETDTDSTLENCDSIGDDYPIEILEELIFGNDLIDFDD